MEEKRPQLSAETRRVAVELGKAKVRYQLQMSASTVKRLLAHAREHYDLTIKPWKTGSGIKKSRVMESLPSPFLHPRVWREP